MNELIWKQDALFSLMGARKHLLAKGQKGAEHILTHYAYNVIDELPLAQLDFDITVKIDKAYDDGFKAGYAQAKVDYLPSVQPKCGKWIRDYNVYYCSECKKHAHIDYNKWDVFSSGVVVLSNFCPSCGADMRGSKNDID